jgi:hypothetical protein
MDNMSNFCKNDKRVERCASLTITEIFWAVLLLGFHNAKDDCELSTDAMAVICSVALGAVIISAG